MIDIDLARAEWNLDDSRLVEVVVLCSWDRDFLSRISPHMKNLEGLFDNPDVEKLYENLLKSYTTNDGFGISDVPKGLRGEFSAALAMYQKGIGITPQRMDDLMRMFALYIKNRKAAMVVGSFARKLETVCTNGDVHEFLDTMKTISSLSFVNEHGYEVFEDGVDLLVMGDEFENDPTGYSNIDDIFHGGVSVPSMNIVGAPSGAGKSLFLQNMAVNYSDRGDDVIVITLELPEHIVAKRIMSMITGIPIRELSTRKEEVNRILSERRNGCGRIFIKRFPMMGTSMLEVMSYVSSLETEMDKKFRHVVIDYMDLMSPIKSDIRVDNIHIRDKYISTEMYNWCHSDGDYRIIWTATQLTKSGREDKASQSGIAGGVDKINAADNIIVFKVIERSAIMHDDQICDLIEGKVIKGRGGGAGETIYFASSVDTLRWYSRDSDMADTIDDSESPDGMMSPESIMDSFMGKS